MSAARRGVDLIPSELRAIEIHKYYLSQAEGREVSLDEAIVDFLINYETDYLTVRQREDSMEQNEEIQRYKWIESEKQGHDIGDEQAAAQWINKYGSLWRAERESLEKNGFLQLNVLIEPGSAITVKIAEVADMARRHDCELYVHRYGMKRYNFKLFGKKEYLNVKSILCPKYLEFTEGGQVEFIATGNGASEVLKEVARFMENIKLSFSP